MDQEVTEDVRKRRGDGVRGRVGDNPSPFSPPSHHILY
jgi:hypothetical protein